MSDVEHNPAKKRWSETMGAHGAVLAFAVAVCTLMYFLAVLPAEKSRDAAESEKKLAEAEKGQLDKRVTELEASLAAETARRNHEEEIARSAQSQATERAERTNASRAAQGTRRCRSSEKEKQDSTPNQRG